MAEAQHKPRIVGRYALHDEIASGGMATVHLGRLIGPVGFARTVAIKRLHPQFSREPEFVSMFLDEARLAARIRHPNVVSTLDVVAQEGELFLVLDYVQGESLSRLLRATRHAGKQVPLGVVSAVIVDTLLGLHAAHTATDELGNSLSIVHRDVSPQNVLVGVDGVARVLDFGIAKASSRLQTTRNGQIKGKLAYMAPEQVEHGAVDARTDIFAVGVVLWETLTGKRLFATDSTAATLKRILSGEVVPPSSVAQGVPRNLDTLVMRALETNPDKRFSSAREMAVSLEQELPRASALVVGGWVEATVPQVLDARAKRLAGVESASLSPAPDLTNDLSGDTDSRLSVPQAKPQEPTRTDLSVSSNLTPQLKPRRSLALLLGLPLAALVLVGVFVLNARVGKEEAALPAAEPAPPATSSLLASAPKPPSAAPADTSAPAPSASAARPQAAPVRTARATKPANKPKPNCVPPWYIDKAGNKRFKPECY